MRESHIFLTVVTLFGGVVVHADHADHASVGVFQRQHDRFADRRSAAGLAVEADLGLPGVAVGAQNKRDSSELLKTIQSCPVYSAPRAFPPRLFPPHHQRCDAWAN